MRALMSKARDNHRVLWARNLADRWVSDKSRREVRVTVYINDKPVRRIVDTLKGFRDGRLTIGSVPMITDLGILEGFDSVTIWSADRDNLLKLVNWFESNGYETSGVW
jgi:hypothetical protein